MNMGYKHIVFDVDGTLIDSEAVVLQSLQQTVMQTDGIDIARHDLRFSLGIPGREVMAELKVRDIEGALAVWGRNFSALACAITLFDGVPDMLAALRKAGCIMGVITSKNRRGYIQGVDKQFPEIAHYFGVTLTTDDTEQHKPHPAPMHRYMELTGAKPAEILYIGDSVYDFECAHSAGVDFALAVWGAGSTKGRQATHFPAHPLEIVPLATSQLAAK